MKNLKSPTIGCEGFEVVNGPDLIKALEKKICNPVIEPINVPFDAELMQVSTTKKLILYKID